MPFVDIHPTDVDTNKIVSYYSNIIQFYKTERVLIMLRRITRNKQVTLPKEFMDRLHLKEGDYVNIEFEDNAIRLRAVLIQEFTNDEYEKLAAKFDQLKESPGTMYEDSPSARKHLKDMMG